MTPEEFHNLALRLGAVQVKPILESVQFQGSGRTFATLGWPAAGWAVVQLTPADQARALAASRGFLAEDGGRGDRGVTLVRLRAVDPADMAAVLGDAWRVAYHAAGVSKAETRPAANTRPEA
jgi:hypothetical protein